MNRPSARELELERRVAVLEAEVVQLRAFMNGVRASLKLEPAPIPTVAPVPHHHHQQPQQPAAIRAPPAVARRHGGIRLWIENVNLFPALLESTRKWLAFPEEFIASSPEEARVILVLVWSPGGRADVTRVPWDSYYNKSVFAVVMGPGTVPVELPAGHVPKTRTVSLLLGDGFDDLKDEKQRALARQFRSVLKAEFPGIQAQIESSVTYPMTVAVHGLSAVGAKSHFECSMIGCQNPALFHCEACANQLYCGVHAKCYDSGLCKAKTK